MVRHQGSKEVARKKHPRQAFSFMSLGARTKGWDKNPPPRDCPYGVFGKRMQRSIMGFGSLATAFYSREMISEATLNASHGTSDPVKSNMRYFHQRLEFHKDSVTIEYKTMCRAVSALFHQFPQIKRDVARAKNDKQPLISSIRKIMKGAHAARNADVNVIRRDIFILSHNDAEKRGWSMPATIEKTSRGIKSECTARFLLPFTERDKYVKDPATYCEQVERNRIKLSLSNTWSAILYDEDMVETDNELAGLFRSETLLRSGITILCSPSAGREWKYPERGARSFAASKKESNAEINGIDKITPEVIAYLSTLVIFAVHDGKYFSRDLGGIDLSELYHDVISVLRTKTEWATETLHFWNEIFFGEGEEEEEGPKISREERFKQLEAKQREREGLGALVTDRFGSQTPPVMTPPRSRHVAGSIPDPGNSPGAGEMEDEGGSRSHQQISQAKVPSPSQSKNGQKRKIATPDSDDSSESDPSDSEDDNVTPPPKKAQRRHSIEQETPPHPIVSTKKKQPTKVPSFQCDSWDDICSDIKRSIEYTMTTGHKEIGAEFTKLMSMGEEKGVRYYNKNHERIEWMKNDVEKKYKSMTGPAAKPPALKKKVPTLGKPTPKTKAPRKGTATSRGSADAMPPPRRVTRRLTAQLSRQNGEDDELDPLTDLDEPPVSPVKSTSTRKKTSVTASSSRLS